MVWFNNMYIFTYPVRAHRERWLAHWAAMKTTFGRLWPPIRDQKGFHFNSVIALLDT